MSSQIQLKDRDSGQPQNDRGSSIAEGTTPSIAEALCTAVEALQLDYAARFGIGAQAIAEIIMEDAVRLIGTRNFNPESKLTLLTVRHTERDGRYMGLGPTQDCLQDLSEFQELQIPISEDRRFFGEVADYLVTACERANLFAETEVGEGIVKVVLDLSCSGKGNPRVPRVDD